MVQIIKSEVNFVIASSRVYRFLESLEPILAWKSVEKRYQNQKITYDKLRLSRPQVVLCLKYKLMYISLYFRDH